MPEKYKTFKAEIRAYGVELPESGWHAVFEMPMPKSWSKKKRAAMDGKPHQSVPDADNLVKATSS